MHQPHTFAHTAGLNLSRHSSVANANIHNTFFAATKLVFGRQKSHPKQAKASPIGVFDSGVGGLSVLQHLQVVLPDEHYIYFADTAHVPYGERSDADIELLTHQAVDWLYAQGCKLVVVACNSASTYSLDSLRPRYGEQLPIVGLVPAIKPAAQSSQTKHIAVLATSATLKGMLLQTVIDEFATPIGVGVHKYFLASLVPWVESGMPRESQGFQELQKLMVLLNDEKIDKLVLGCTHYPFFKPIITQLAPRLDVVDSGEAIARRVRQLLTSKALLAQPANQKVLSYESLSGQHVSNKHENKHELLSDNVTVYSTGDPSEDLKKINRLKILNSGI